MNDFILAEVNFFLASFIFGALLFLAYDILVILRNIIRHAKFVIAIEDIGFWITAGILIFCMMYLMNDGTIRYYAVISVILGMKLYQVLLGKQVVHIGSLFGTWVKKLLKRFFHFLSTPLRLLFQQLKKCSKFLANIIGKRFKFILHFIRKQLKKRVEKVKIKRRKHRNQKQVEQKEPEKICGVLELITLPSEKGELYEAIEEKEKKRT
jgi:spore cortex biosynthesis protein YabQ